MLELMSHHLRHASSFSVLCILFQTPNLSPSEAFFQRPARSMSEIRSDKEARTRSYVRGAIFVEENSCHVFRAFSGHQAYSFLMTVGG